MNSSKRMELQFPLEGRHGEMTTEKDVLSNEIFHRGEIYLEIADFLAISTLRSLC